MRARLAGIALAIALVSSCNERAPARVTEINEERFRIVLPGQWYEGPAGELELVWRYECCGGAEMVGISFLPSIHELRGDEISELMERFLSHRLEGEGKIDGHGIGEPVPEVRPVGEKLMATYSGVDNAGNRFASKIVAYRFGIGSFYYSASGLSADQFEDRRIAVFNNAEVLD